jgi:hypothetical protein
MAVKPGAGKTWFVNRASVFVLEVDHHVTFFATVVLP